VLSSHFSPGLGSPTTSVESAARVTAEALKMLFIEQLPAFTREAIILFLLDLLTRYRNPAQVLSELRRALAQTMRRLLILRLREIELHIRRWELPARRPNHGFLASTGPIATSPKCRRTCPTFVPKTRFIFHSLHACSLMSFLSAKSSCPVANNTAGSGHLHEGDQPFPSEGILTPLSAA